LKFEAFEEIAVEESSEIEYIQFFGSVLKVHDKYLGHLAGVVG